MKPLILASSSPRRKALMKLLDVQFEAIAPDIDEALTIENPETLAKALALQKATAIKSRYPDRVIIGCDTVVALDTLIFGKPVDDEDAKRMLQSLSGKTHRVITGCAVLEGDNETVFISEANVTFDKITEQEIDAYIATKEPFGKAGAYAIQGFGAKHVYSILGDYYAVMGFPINKLYQVLKSINTLTKKQG